MVKAIKIVNVKHADMPKTYARNSSSAPQVSGEAPARTMRERRTSLMPNHRRSRLHVLAAATATLLGWVSAAGANEVCHGVPTELDEQAARDAFGAATAAAFVKARAPLEAVLDAVCATNRDSAHLFKKEARRVVFEIAAGATEPSPYLQDNALIVDFYGGDFDAAQFRHDVEAALRGDISDSND